MAYATCCCLQDAKRIAERLVQKHGKYFDPAKVDVSQVSLSVSALYNLMTRVLILAPLLLRVPRAPCS
jgi:hypothetical protein